MLFEWDPDKAKINLHKHGVSFELALTVFRDPFHLSIIENTSNKEERWITIGVSANTKTLVVVHAYRQILNGNEVIRIISARPATKREKLQYEEGI